MTLLVRDEADIVRDMLDAHYALGVDFVVATDNLSVDGTDAILEQYQAEGRLRLLRETDDDYAQARWVTRMARLAATDHDADWVINADADEFWLPTSGDLKATLATVPDEVGVITAHRVNFIPRDDGDPSWYRRMRWRYATSVNHEGVALPPKVLHRAHPEAQVFMGNHWVEHDAGAELDDGRIEVLHFPMRSYAQFAGKIVKGGEALERNTEIDPGLGTAWRRALDAHRAGRFEEQWRAWVPSDDELAAMVADGSVVEDLRVCDLLDRLRTTTPAGASALSSEPTRPRGLLGRLRRR